MFDPVAMEPAGKELPKDVYFAQDSYDAARGALVCAVDAGYPKAGEAIEALDAVAWEGEKLGAGRKAAWSASPKWSIVPRP